MHLAIKKIREAILSKLTICSFSRKIKTQTKIRIKPSFKIKMKVKKHFPPTII